MSSAIRVYFYVGIGLGLFYLVMRTIRHRGVGWPVTDFLEAVGLVLIPLPIVPLTDVFGKAVGSKRIPIFNDWEHRLVLLIGTAVLIGAVLLGAVVGIQRAWRQPKKAAGKASAADAVQEVV